MQKVLRRTALAKSQAKRKARIFEEKRAKQERNDFRRAENSLAYEIKIGIKREKLRRREDWDLGALSPWRNSMQSMLDQGFGTFSQLQAIPPDKPEMDRRKDWMLQKGDRVCIMEGHPSVKGRIGTIRDVNKESDTATLEGLNTVDIFVAANLRSINDGAANFTTREVGIPYEQLRLVYPLPDPSTGIRRDVIINKLEIRNRHFSVADNEEVFDRYLMPQRIRISWPVTTVPKYKNEEGDSLRLQTEGTPTFLPTLTTAPMPVSVIDELRNKYSIFRDRHDDDYVQKKVQEDIQAEAENLRKKSLMPRGARNVARTRRRSEKSTGIPDTVAAVVGTHIASKGPVTQAEQGGP